MTIARCPRDSRRVKLTSFLLSFALVLLLVPLLRPLATRIGLLDYPSSRKRHRGAVPLVGGLAVCIAFIATVLVLGEWGFVTAPFLLGASLILLLGLSDDRRPLPSSTRFGFQAFVICVAVVLGDHVLHDLGAIAGSWPSTLGLLAIPFTVFGLVGIVNAVNLSDGADGLTGGIALTAFAAFAWYFHDVMGRGAWPEGLDDARPAILALAGAVAAFLVFNLRAPWRARASIFLGDSGSLFLGFVLGWVAIYACTSFGTRSLAPVAALWILIVPLFDTLGCIVRRLLQGRSPTAADRQHAHHLLQRAGLSVGQTSAVLIAANAAGALIGILGWRLGVPDVVMFVAIALLFGAYCGISIALWRRFDVRSEVKTILEPVFVSGAEGPPGASVLHMRPRASRPAAIEVHPPREGHTQGPAVAG